MSTEYKIAPDVELHEASCNVCFAIDNHDGFMTSRYISAQELEQSIIKQVRVLSYISDDPEKVLRRFNVNYHQDTHREVLFEREFTISEILQTAGKHKLPLDYVKLNAFLNDMLKLMEQSNED